MLTQQTLLTSYVVITGLHFYDKTSKKEAFLPPYFECVCSFACLRVCVSTCLRSCSCVYVYECFRVSLGVGVRVNRLVHVRCSLRVCVCVYMCKRSCFCIFVRVFA